MNTKRFLIKHRELADHVQPTFLAGCFNRSTESILWGGWDEGGCDIMEILAVHLVPLHDTWMHCKSLGCTEASVWMQIGAVQTGDERERGA